jgi:hypothetical protein
MMPAGMVAATNTSKKQKPKTPPLGVLVSSLDRKNRKAKSACEHSNCNNLSQHQTALCSNMHTIVNVAHMVPKMLGTG